MVPYEAFSLIFGFNSYSARAKHSGVLVTEHFLFRCYPKDLKLQILTAHVIVYWVQATLGLTSIQFFVSANVCIISAARSVCNFVILAITPTLHERNEI